MHTEPLPEAGPDAPGFSDDERHRKLEQIKAADLPEAARYACINLWLFEFFRWALLLCSAMVTILAAVKEFSHEPSFALGIALIALGALTTLASAAIDQFDSRRIKWIYDRKVFALRFLIDQLEYLAPAKASFVMTLGRVRTWTADSEDSDIAIFPPAASNDPGDSVADGADPLNP